MCVLCTFISFLSPTSSVPSRLTLRAPRARCARVWSAELLGHFKRRNNPETRGRALLYSGARYYRAYIRARDIRIFARIHIQVMKRKTRDFITRDVNYTILPSACVLEEICQRIVRVSRGEENFCTGRFESPILSRKGGERERRRKETSRKKNISRIVVRRTRQIGVEVDCFAGPGISLILDVGDCDAFPNLR